MRGLRNLALLANLSWIILQQCPGRLSILIVGGRRVHLCNHPFRLPVLQSTLHLIYIPYSQCLPYILKLVSRCGDNSQQCTREYNVLEQAPLASNNSSTAACRGVTSSSSFLSASTTSKVILPRFGSHSSFFSGLSFVYAFSYCFASLPSWPGSLNDCFLNLGQNRCETTSE